MKILIVDDHSLFADALAMALELHNFNIVKATTCAQALAIASESEFDLVLLDMNLRDSHGEVLLTTFKRNSPDWKVIVVSSVQVDCERIKSLGADGFVNKAESMPMMIKVIDSVLAGKSGFSHIETLPAKPHEITPRQLEIIAAMSDGLANKEIAHILNISEGTVKQHVNSIFKTLDVKNRSQCLIKAAQLNLV